MSSGPDRPIDRTTIWPEGGCAARTKSLSSSGPRCCILGGTMELQPDVPIGGSPGPDDFPGLYRAALAAAAELERRGDRRAAVRLRREAADAYSVWDEQGRRRLLALIDGVRRSQSRGTSRPGPDRPPDARAGS